MRPPPRKRRRERRKCCKHPGPTEANTITTTTCKDGRSTSTPLSILKKKGKVLQLPPLTGKYQFIKAMCESQLRKKIADHLITMFKIHCETQDRFETLARFKITNIDKDDKDKNGKGKEKSFIPISLRSKQPLNHSKK